MQKSDRRREHLLCMKPAPARIGVTIPPDKDGMLRNAWCHKPLGHEGPCACVEGQWVSTYENES